MRKVIRGISFFVISILFLSGCGKKADKFDIYNSNILLGQEESAEISYDLQPSDIENNISWKSEDEKIAKVQKGIITYVGEGQTTVVGSVGGLSNSVNVICIKAKSLNQAFEEAKNVFEGFEGVEDCVDPMKVFEKSVKLAGDGSYLAFDTNPANVQHQRKYSKLLAQIDELESTYVYTSIVTTLKSLGFTESTLNKIKNTTALQGVQSDDSKYYRASWTFHPTNGLEITFEFHK